MAKYIGSAEDTQRRKREAAGGGIALIAATAPGCSAVLFKSKPPNSPLLARLLKMVQMQGGAGWVE